MERHLKPKCLNDVEFRTKKIFFQDGWTQEVAFLVRVVPAMVRVTLNSIGEADPTDESIDGIPIVAPLMSHVQDASIRSDNFSGN
jgi:hypothetical protein